MTKIRAELGETCGPTLALPMTVFTTFYLGDKGSELAGFGAEVSWYREDTKQPELQWYTSPQGSSCKPARVTSAVTSKNSVYRRGREL